MTQQEPIYNIEDIIDHFKPPILILSTSVGKGMYNIGEAVRERFPPDFDVRHIPIEELLPECAINEDFKRYKFIATYFRFLLYFIYTVPFFYYRKLLRESISPGNALHKLEKELKKNKIKTVICISHRAAFWVSNLKKRKRMDLRIWDVLGEYGHNWGYKYLFWSEIDGFLSPLEKNKLRFNFPAHVQFIRINLPARRNFCNIAETKGDPNKVVLVCGFWGQGPIIKIAQLLLKNIPQVKIHAICGENTPMYEDMKEVFKNTPHVCCYGIVQDLGIFLKESASIITKPGISTILEAHAAKRKIFLLKGMPVAEDNNARYAIDHFGAEWFSIDAFNGWHKGTHKERLNE